MHNDILVIGLLPNYH